MCNTPTTKANGQIRAPGAMRYYDNGHCEKESLLPTNPITLLN